MATVRSRGPARAKPRTDAYVGLLIVSLIALCTAMLFAYLDWSSFPQTKPKSVQIAPRSGAPAGGPTGIPAAPQAGQPGAPQPGAPQPGVPPGNVPPPPPAKK